jgi:uncharacterized membrane protein YgcG
MKKRWLVIAMSAFMVCSLTACKKDDVSATSDYVETIETETEEVVESTEDITEAAVETEGFVKVSDIKDDTLARSVTQSKNGLRQLCLAAGMTDVEYDLLTSADNLFSTLGITEEDLLKLTTQDELSEYLLEKGLTEDEIYCYSIYMYLLDALSKGDDSEDESLKDYLTKTKDLLAANDLDFDALINTRDFSELKTLVDASSLSLYELNCKLWVNEIFPGVDINASDLWAATTPDEFLAVFTDADIKLDDLAEKAAEPNKAEELLGTLKQIEKESIAAEEESKSGGGSSSGSSGSSSSGGSTASSVAESIANKETEAQTIPDNGGSNTITVLVGNEGSSTTGTTSSSSSSSSNTTGKATITFDGEEETVRIVVKKILRGDRAISEINASNANMPGSITVDEDDEDFDWVAVKFTVKRLESSSSETTLRPLVRVKNMSGANIETVATHVFYIEPELTTDSDDYNTYWVAFRIPEEQSKFMLYFGDTTGSVYKFKSTALEEDDDD